MIDSHDLEGGVSDHSYVQVIYVFVHFYFGRTVTKVYRALCVGDRNSFLEAY